MLLAQVKPVSDFINIFRNKTFLRTLLLHIDVTVIFNSVLLAVATMAVKQQYSQINKNQNYGKDTVCINKKKW